MKFAVPWSVKGIRPEARETAKEAARRSGMPLGEWLNSVILQQADEDGAHGSSYRDDDDSYGDELAGVHQRLDDITRRIEQFTRGPAAFAPKAGRAEPARDAQSRETAQLAQLIARLDQRIEQIAQIPRMMAAPPMAPGMAPHMPQPAMAPGMAPQGLDRAVAEIAARQRALSGGAAPGRPQQPQPPVPPQVQAYAPPHAQAYTPAPVMMPVPSQDLSGLEEHLRKITDQIETLRRPGVEDAINALRAELGDIAQALSDAMPRHAIEAIERQIQGLTQRIAEGRQSGNIAGVDGSALSGIEHGLAEVRDALRGLTPAESLVGFNEAVNGLAHKIDLIVAQKDPAALGQLEHAITTLRDMAGHVASNETVGRLAAQVQHLADKVEQYGVGSGAGDALNSLEHRISALADALAERSQNGASVPPRLEALVESLSDKIEQIQQTRGDSAVGHLEDHIVALVQRLDASDSRLGHLEAIERGLGDLLVHIEELRANKGSGGLREDNSQGVAELKHDIARTQNALDAVHGTLGLVVDRLATIERDVRAARSPLDLELTDITQPVGRIAARAVSDAPPPAAPPQPVMQPQIPPQAPPQAAPAPPPLAPRPQAAAPQQAPQQPAAKAKPLPQRLPPAARLPINPDLPPDQPLEPGTAPPRFQANAAARIAASEAALGGAHAQPNGPAGKSGFIAAARRAAQAAIETATPRKPQFDAATEADDSERPTLRASVMKRVKSLLIAASIVAIVIGMVQIGGSLFKFGSANTAKEQSAQSPNTVPAADADSADADERAATETEPQASSDQPALPLSPPVLPGLTTPAPATGGNPPATAPLSMNPPSLLSPPALTQNPDVTGSIGRNTLKQNPARPTAAPTPAKPEAERLPIALGGARLRSAAVAGDAAAAYEVALRFAEGRGVPANQEEAARWYERAASKGLVPAQFRYASLLEKGTGVKKNLGQARKLYLAAATQGHAKAMHNLAVLYAEGIEGKPDYATAALWFRKAAQHGIADSQYNLGVLCARGLGTDKNIAEAYKWFALAAAQGDREAAKKRDDVAAHLDADELASARDTAKSFVPEPQPQSTINVPVPQGGWDDATTAAPQPTKPRGGRAISANVSGLPLNIGAR
jgi:localization factor PodJL